ncbi:MAG: hypothetical protein H6654_03190 [Ardenticatenaceae bacterium]|nr:hypothetical protein [Anaerolineales bacterium]MCB8941198.1 hypothetical protein [Ardenticatenaceae bacterium]MCB8972536.1 hypothetical protein [Ardenticatenaceae bacterium]
MDYGNLFRRGWEIVWQNKYLFILGFLAALGGGSGGNSGGNFNYSVPGPSGSDVPAEMFEEFTQFWTQYGGLILGLFCFFFILGIVFWLIRLAAVGGLIESVDRIEAGEKMSLGKAFSAGVARIWSLVGLSVLLNLPFILVGLLFASFGGSFFVTAMRNGGDFAGFEPAFGGFFACLGLLACFLVPLGIVVAIVQPFAMRGLVLKQLGVVDSIRHGWQVVRDNIGDILLLGIAFMVIGFLFGLVTLVFTLPFAFLAAGPFLLDAIQGNTIDFGVTEVLSLAFGGLCLGLVGAAVNSVLTAYRSATVTLAYHQFVQKPVIGEP